MTRKERRFIKFLDKTKEIHNGKGFIYIDNRADLANAGVLDDQYKVTPPTYDGTGTRTPYVSDIRHEPKPEKDSGPIGADEQTKGESAKGTESSKAPAAPTSNPTEPGDKGGHQLGADLSDQGGDKGGDASSNSEDKGLVQTEAGHGESEPMDNKDCKSS